LLLALLSIIHSLSFYLLFSFNFVYYASSERRCPHGKELPNKKRSPAEEAEEEGDSPGDVDDEEEEDSESSSGDSNYAEGESGTSSEEDDRDEEESDEAKHGVSEGGSNDDEVDDDNPSRIPSTPVSNKVLGEDSDTPIAELLANKLSKRAGSSTSCRLEPKCTSGSSKSGTKSRSMVKDKKRKAGRMSPDTGKKARKKAIKEKDNIGEKKGDTLTGNEQDNDSNSSNNDKQGELTVVVFLVFCLL